VKGIFIVGSQWNDMEFVATACDYQIFMFCYFKKYLLAVRNVDTSHNLIESHVMGFHHHVNGICTFVGLYAR
jgi:hypothetical protein